MLHLVKLSYEIGQKIVEHTILSFNEANFEIFKVYLAKTSIRGIALSIEITAGQKF